ncbi:MAG: disulfide oxidoreductase, partial [Ruegeria sp.]
IRIDMLERLADMLRAEDSRGGFEAKPDMLSITGMTLDQFADLMQGLGYKAEKAEREKVKPAPDESSEANDAPVQTAAEEPSGTEVSVDEAVVPTETTETVVEPTENDDAVADEPPCSDEPEVEVFYTFTWGRQPTSRSQGQRREQRQGQPKGKPRGKSQDGRGKPHGKKGGKPQQGAKTFSSRPPKKEKAIDPDNPFAALMALKEGN